MSFDAHSYHVEKRSLPNYLGSPNVIGSTMWQHTATGLELARKEDQMPFTGIVVGRVSPFRLKCGPAGNHMNSEVSPLVKAKYQFHLCRPADHELGVDFDASMATLDAMQKQVGKTGHCKNMLIEDITGTMLRCVKTIFSMRVCASEYFKLSLQCEQEDVIPDSPHGQSKTNAPQMDEETRNWPIPDQFVAKFDDLKYNYEACPLPLFHDGHLVEPSMANEVMNGAIVEVQFNIHQWHIQQFDSFQANVEKVVILRPSLTHHTSRYKRPLSKTTDDDEPKAKKTHYNAEASSSKT